MDISIGQAKYKTCLAVTQLDYNLDKLLLEWAKDTLVLILILSLICYLSLKRLCYLFIGSFSNFCVPWLSFFFLILFLFLFFF